MAKAQHPTDIDGYIPQFPADVQAVLRDVRAAIRRAAPEAEETISYRMPAFRQHGVLVYFAAWKAHVGLYPPITGDVAVERAVARYAGPKGNLQFPLAEPVPLALIERVVRLPAPPFSPALLATTTAEYPGVHDATQREAGVGVPLSDAHAHG